VSVAARNLPGALRAPTFFSSAALRLCVILFFPLVLTACGRSDDHYWLGYAEGDNIFISAPQSGWVTDMTVERGSVVKPGEALFTLDATHEVAARDQALATIAQDQAQIAQEQANLVYTGKELSRQSGLARVNAGVPSTLDQTLASHQQSQAHIAQLQALLKQAQAALVDANYQLAQRTVISYIPGHVEDIYFRTGEYAPASTPVLSVLPPKNIYVRFFVPETQFAKVKLGERVRITCDGCTPMDATITFIAQQEEYTPPVIFSEGNREKLVFKLEARAPGGLKLNPGQPVEVRPI
jgi:HlyD family secretion protein